MSYQTTMARAAVRAARTEWRVHNKVCQQCRGAEKARQPGKRCAAGQELGAALLNASRALEREKTADRAPVPGQGGLW